MGSITSISSYLQSLLANPVKSGSTIQSDSTSSTSSVTSNTDKQELSPFAKLMSMLQKLQESDPAQYQQVTQQIATNLQSAAKSAESDGNTTAATQLNQLADDFTKASKTGELPDVADLAKAVGGHHHHMPPPSDSTGDGTSGTSSSSSSSDSASQTLAQLFAMAQYGTSGGSSSTSQDPMAIIMQTLSDAGVSITGA